MSTDKKAARIAVAWFILTTVVVLAGMAMQGQLNLTDGIITLLAFALSSVLMFFWWRNRLRKILGPS